MNYSHDIKISTGRRENSKYSSNNVLQKSRIFQNFIEIPPSIQNLLNISHLKLVFNKLSGKIQSSIGNLKNFKC